MAAVVVWRSKHRMNLRRNRVFRDRKNPLDMYDKFRFRRHDILTIVDELRDDLEYPDTRQLRPLAGYSASCSGIADVCEFVSRTWWLRPSASTSQPQKAKFLRLAGFLTVVACIDGTHVRTSTNMSTGRIYTR